MMQKAVDILIILNELADTSLKLTLGWHFFEEASV